VIGDHELFADQSQKVRLQGRNAYDQTKEVVRLIKSSGGVLAITPAVVMGLHKFAIKDIYACAGEYRTGSVRIKNSRHIPPDYQHIEGLVETMCDIANSEREWTHVKTAAFLMWRLNWIHPFGGGNGRTSRAIAYLALCVRLGFLPPGQNSITMQVNKKRQQYQDALEDADRAWETGVLDVGKMTEFVDESLVQQFLSFPNDDPDT
jgi:Fic family protein